MPRQTQARPSGRCLLELLEPRLMLAIGDIQWIPPLSGYHNAWPVGIDDTGRVLVDSWGPDDTGSFSSRAFLWRNGQVTDVTALFPDMPVLPGMGAGNVMTGFGDNGKAIGCDLTDNGESTPDFKGFVLDVNTGQIQWILPLSGYHNAWPVGIDDTGRVLVDSWGPDDTGSFSSRAFLWRNGQVTDVTALFPDMPVLPGMGAGNVMTGFGDNGKAIGCDLTDNGESTPDFKGFVLTMEEPFLSTISGYVQDGFGHNLPHVAVTLEQDSGSFQPTTIYSNDQGFFAFNGLSLTAGNDYRLRVDLKYHPGISASPTCLRSWTTIRRFMF